MNMNPPSPRAVPAEPGPPQPAHAVGLRRGNLLLAALLALSFPLAHALPTFWGWENGPLENAQAVILLVGALAAAWAAYSQRGTPGAPLWWVALPCWWIALGRELAWGAVFLPPMGHGEWGPVISSKVLWYRPAVPWVCAAVLLLCGYWALRHHLWSQVLQRLQQERAWPVASLLLPVLAAVISHHAEGHGGVRLHDWLGTQVLVLEELVEVWGYAALWLAQWALIGHTARWRHNTS